jgi:DNA-binding transcriptional LysR family regulator
MKSFDLGLLAALNALLTTGSVTRAAERVHLSTPAMSHTLARLREMLGDPLFVRAGRRLVPTPRALALREPVGRLLEEAHALLLPQGDRALAAAQRRFIVRAPEGIPMVFGGALALALQETLPLCSLHFLPQEPGDQEALREGRIDIEIGDLHLKAPEVESVVLSAQKLMGVARAGHPLLKGRLTVARFAAEPQVSLSVRPGEVSAVDAALADAGHARRTVLGVPSAHAAMMVAARSSLVACVPERTARAMHAGLGLVLFELPLAVPIRPSLMAWHPRHSADPAHTWLRGCIQRVMAAASSTPPPSVTNAAASPRARRATAKRL